MDNPEQSERRHFWRRFFYSLIAFSILYIAAVRPLTDYLNTHVVYPVFSHLAQKGDIIIIQTNHRSIVIELNNSKVATLHTIPFSSTFWITFILLWPARNWKVIRALVYFNSALLLMSLGLSLLFIWGHILAAILLNVLNYLSYIFYLIFLLLSVRSIVLSYRGKKTD